MGNQVAKVRGHAGFLFRSDGWALCCRRPPAYENRQLRHTEQARPKTSVSYCDMRQATKIATLQTQLENERARCCALSEEIKLLKEAAARGNQLVQDQAVQIARLSAQVEAIALGRFVPPVKLSARPSPARERRRRTSSSPTLPRPRRRTVLDLVGCRCGVRHHRLRFPPSLRVFTCSRCTRVSFVKARTPQKFEPPIYSKALRKVLFLCRSICISKAHVEKRKA